MAIHVNVELLQIIEGIILVVLKHPKNVIDIAFFHPPTFWKVIFKPIPFHQVFDFVSNIIICKFYRTTIPYHVLQCERFVMFIPRMLLTDIINCFFKVCHFSFKLLQIIEGIKL